MRVTEAVVVPKVPIPVMVTAEDEGIVAGAVYRPLEVMVPALACQTAT